MKLKRLFIWLSIAAIACSCQPNLYDVHYEPTGDEGELSPSPFKRGFNLAGTFEVGYPEAGTGNGTAKDIWMGHINDETFAFIQSLGCDVVRVPMQLGQFITSNTDYTLTKEFWDKLDILLDLGEKYNIAVIIDNHQWGYCKRWSSDHAMGFMNSIWTQIPEHCKNRKNIIYELLNEPDGDWWKDHWIETEVELVKTIRKVDTVHDIVVCPMPYHTIAELPEFDDKHIIYTNHFYEPFVFTHQGATWSGLGDVSLHFPYDPLQDDLSVQVPAASQEELSNYSYRGTVDYIQNKLDVDLNEVARRKGRFFIGEFGCELITVDQDSRNNWHECVRKHLESRGAAWTLWSFALDFGIFKNTTSAVVNYDKDLNVPLARALGLTIPPSYIGGGGDESDFITCVLYDDDWGEGIAPVETEKLDYLTIPCYDDPAPNSNNCIRWVVGGAWQNYLVYRFESLCKDLTQFDIENSYLRFKIRCQMSHPQQFAFGIWFLNNKNEFDTPAKQHNWVKYYWVSAADVTADGQWHEVSIPIKYFDFRNAEDAEVSSKGNFDWSKVMEIEFCSFDKETIAGEEIFLDDVIITGPKNEEWEPEPEPTESYVIFDEGPAEGWELGGTSGKYSVSTDYASSGSKSLKWEANPNNSWASCVNLSRAIDASECAYITFKAKFVNSTLQANDVLRIQLSSTDPTKYAECNMAAQDATSTGWVTYKIKKSEFDGGTLDWSTLNVINFYTPGWGSQGTATIYVDELTLVGVSPVQPGPGPGPGPDPEPTEGLKIFDEGAATGWTIGGTSGKYSVSTDYASSGSKSLKWDASPNNSWASCVNLTKTVDASECTSISFKAKFVNSTLQANDVLRIQLSSKDASKYAECNMAAQDASSTGWVTYNIQKSEFNGGTLDWSTLTTINFYTPGWGSQGTATIYLDEITLVGVSSEDPGPGPGPEPTGSYYIFDDAMQNGWTLSGTQNKYEISKSQAYRGTSSIWWYVDQNTSWGRILSFTKSKALDASDCETVGFYTKFLGSSFSHEFQWVVARIQAVDSDGHYSEASFSAPTSQDWTLNTIKVSDFTGGTGVDWSKLTGLCFYTPGWNSGTAEIFFDDITLNGISEEPDPQPSGSLQIFSDSMQNGWKLGGTDNKFSVSTDYAASGTSSIKWVLDSSSSWARVLTLEPAAQNSDFSAYSGIQFKIKFVSSTFTAGNCAFQNRPYGKDSESYINVYAPSSDAWQTITQNFSDFTIQTGKDLFKHLNNFCFHTVGWYPGTAVVYIDDIKLIK